MDGRIGRREQQENDAEIGTHEEEERKRVRQRRGID